MLLLQRLQQKVKRRRRVRDLWLLILRIIAVWLAVLAISQPRFEWIESDADLGIARAVVVVVDTSMSMDQRPIHSVETIGKASFLIGGDLNTTPDTMSQVLAWCSKRGFLHRYSIRGISKHDLDLIKEICVLRRVSRRQL